MTREQKIEIFTMRIDGSTLQEIGDKYGVTREYIRQILNKTVQQESIMKRGRDKIIFPNIAKRMEIKQISIKDLTILMGYKDKPSNYDLFSRKLRSKANWRMADIRKMLEITGMTFEIAFQTKEVQAVE